MIEEPEMIHGAESSFDPRPRAEQEDVTELESLRLKERLMVNPHDPDALKFFSVLEQWKSSQQRT